MFVHEWVFGEIKVIHKPISSHAPSPKLLGVMDSTMTVETPAKDTTQSATTATKLETEKITSLPVITENEHASKTMVTKKCNVRIERLLVQLQKCSMDMVNTNSYNMRTRPAQEPVTHRTSDQPSTIIDYSQFMTWNEEDTSPPHKKCTVNLLCTPSSSCIAAQNYHTKPTTTP